MEGRKADSKARNWETWKEKLNQEGDEMNDEIYLVLVSTPDEFDAFAFKTKESAWGYILEDSKDMHGYLDEENPYVGKATTTEDSLFLREIEVYYEIKKESVSN